MRTGMLVATLILVFLVGATGAWLYYTQPQLESDPFMSDADITKAYDRCRSYGMNALAIYNQSGGIIKIVCTSDRTGGD